MNMDNRVTMGRSKEMGKAVSELTPVELERERQRCEALAKVYGNKVAGKLIRKRLREVEMRLARERDG